MPSKYDIKDPRFPWWDNDSKPRVTPGQMLDMINETAEILGDPIKQPDETKQSIFGWFLGKKKGKE